MKSPNHIILDMNADNLSYSTRYWAVTYFLTINKNCSVLNSVKNNKKFKINKNMLLNNKFFIQNQFTIKHNLLNELIFASGKKKKILNNLIKITNKHKNQFIKESSFFKKLQMLFIKTIFNKKLIKNMFKFKIKKNKNLSIFKSSKLWDTFNISYLKKEKIYTKLKYSRTPQYDIVSGGSAAILSGFLGFLICEKFGFELLDSCDFYFLFMYLVFISFFLKLCIKLISNEFFNWTLLSFKWLFNFYYLIFFLILSYFKTK